MCSSECCIQQLIADNLLNGEIPEEAVVCPSITKIEESLHCRKQNKNSRNQNTIIKKKQNKNETFWKVKVFPRNQKEMLKKRRKLKKYCGTSLIE